MNDIDSNKILNTSEQGDIPSVSEDYVDDSIADNTADKKMVLVRKSEEVKTLVAKEDCAKEADVRGSNASPSCNCTCGNSSNGACKCSGSKSECGTCDCKSKKGGCCTGKYKLEVYDWMQDMPGVIKDAKIVEVQFKNTRKGYYLNSNDLEIYRGDIVAVEATPGHDIGEVVLTGKLAEIQMLKSNYRGDVKRVYRLAKPNDMDKYQEAKKLEHKTMLRAREIAEEIGLAMKISDVEYQGDGNKAIFYYIADERVDFRQLIKVYASEFRVKIEMKQIGARQEAGRVGGIGPCGRELCCSSSMSNFISVSTSAARIQDIPLNPQKLAGQCGKLKCCLNFEVDVYVEAQRGLPPREIPLHTKDSTYFHFKTDILSGEMIYSTDKIFAANLVNLSKDRVYEVLRMNKKGDKPASLEDKGKAVVDESAAHDLLDQDSINRFDREEGFKGDADKRRKRGRKTNKKVGSNGELSDVQNKEQGVVEQQPRKKITRGEGKPESRKKDENKVRQRPQHKEDNGDGQQARRSVRHSKPNNKSKFNNNQSKDTKNENPKNNPKSGDN